MTEQIKEPTVSNPVEAVVSAATPKLSVLFIAKWGSHIKVDKNIITVRVTELFQRRWADSFNSDIQKLPLNWVVRYEAH